MRRMNHWTAAIAALIVPNALQAQVRPGSVWMMQNHKAEVAIYRCGDAVCGRVSKVLKYPKDGARTDIHNADASLRNRPLLGLPVLLNFTDDGDKLEGRVYDPKSGHSYRATLSERGGDRLVLKACVLFICKSQEWTRLR